MSQPSWSALRAAHGRDPTTPRGKVVSTRRTPTPSRPTTCPSHVASSATPPYLLTNRYTACGGTIDSMDSPSVPHRPPPISATGTIPASDLRKVLAERAASSTLNHNGASHRSTMPSTVITPSRPHHNHPTPTSSPPHTVPPRRPTPTTSTATSLRLSFPPSAQNDVRKRIEYIQHECEEVRNNVRIRQSKIETSIACVNASVARLDGQADLEAVDTLLMDANRARRDYASNNLFGGGLDGVEKEEDMDVEELAREEANKEARRIDRCGDNTTAPTSNMAGVLVTSPSMDKKSSNEDVNTNTAAILMPSSGDHTPMNTIHKQSTAGHIIIDPVGERKIKQLLELSRMQGKEMERLREEAQEAKRLLSTKESKLSESEALVHHQRLKITSLNGTLRDGGGGGGGGNSTQSGSSGKAGGASNGAASGGGTGGSSSRLPALLANAQQLTTLQRENAAASTNYPATAGVRVPPQDGVAAANANSAAALAAITPVHVPMCVPGWLTGFSAAYHSHPLLPLNSGRNGDVGGMGDGGEDGLVEDDSLASDSSTSGEDFYDDAPPNASSTNFHASSTFQTESDDDADGNNAKRQECSLNPPLSNSIHSVKEKGGGGALRNVSFSHLVTQVSRVAEPSDPHPARSLSSIAAKGTTTKQHRQYSRAELTQALYCDEVNVMLESCKSASWGKYPAKHAITRLYGYWQPHVALVESSATNNKVREGVNTPKSVGAMADRGGSFAASSARSSRRGSQRYNSSTPGTPSTSSVPVKGMPSVPNKNRRASVAPIKSLDDAGGINNVPRKASSWSVHEAPRMCFVVSGSIPFSDQIHALLPKTEVSAIWSIILRCLRAAAHLTYKSLKTRCRQILTSSGSLKTSTRSYKQRPGSVTVTPQGTDGLGDQKSAKSSHRQPKPSLQSIHDSALFNDVDDGSETHASVECAALLCCGGGILSSSEMDTLSFSVLHSTLEGAMEFSKIFQTLLAVVGKAHQEAAEGMAVALPGTYADAATLQEHLIQLENLGRGSRVVIPGFAPSLAVLSNLCVSTGPSSTASINPQQPPSLWSLFQTRKMKEHSRRRGSKSGGNTRRRNTKVTPVAGHVGDGSDLPDPATAFPFRMCATNNSSNTNSSRPNYKFDFKVTCVIDVAVKDGYDVVEITNHLSSADSQEEDHDDGPLSDPRLHTIALFPHALSGVPVISGGALAISAALLRSVQDSYVAQITEERDSQSTEYTTGFNKNLAVPSTFEGRKYCSSMVGSTLISPLVLKWVRAVEVLEEEESSVLQQGNEKMRKKLSNAKPKGVSLIHFQLSRVRDSGAAPGPNSVSTTTNIRGSISATTLGAGTRSVSFGNVSSSQDRRGTNALPNLSSLKMPPSGTWKTSLSLCIPYTQASRWASMTTYNSLTTHDDDDVRESDPQSSSHVLSASPQPMFFNRTGVFSDGDMDEFGDLPPPAGGKQPLMFVAEAEVITPTHEVCAGLESTEWVQRLQNKPTMTLEAQPLSPSQAPHRLLGILGMSPPIQRNEPLQPNTNSIPQQHRLQNPQATFGVVTIALNLPLHLRSLLSDTTTRAIINLVELHMDRLAETYFGPKVAVSEQPSGTYGATTSRGSFVVAMSDRYEGQWVLLVRGGNSKEVESSSSYPTSSAAATLAGRLIRFSTLLQEALLKFSYWPLELFSRDQSAIEKRVLVGDGSTTRVLYRGPRVKIGIDMVMDNHPLRGDSSNSGGSVIPPWLSWDYLSNKLVFHTVCASGSTNTRSAVGTGGAPPPRAPSNLSFRDRFGSPQDEDSLNTRDVASSSPPHLPISGVAVRPLSQALVDGLTPSVRGYVAAVGLSSLQSDRLKPTKHAVPDSPLCWSVKLCGVAKGGQVLLSHTVALQATLENEQGSLLQNGPNTNQTSSSSLSALPQIGASSISLLSSPLDGILLGPCGIALISNAAQICSAAKEDTTRQLRRILLSQKEVNNGGGGSPRGGRTTSPRSASVVSGLSDISTAAAALSPSGPVSPDFTSSQPTLTQHDIPKVSALVLKESAALLTGTTSCSEMVSGGGSKFSRLHREIIKDTSYGPTIVMGVFAAQLAPLALRSAEEIEFGEFQTAYGDLLHAGVISTNLYKYPFVSLEELDKEMAKQMEHERLTKRKSSTTFQYSADCTPPTQSGAGKGTGGSIAPHVRTLAIETLVSTLIPTPDDVPTAASQSAVGDRLTGHLWSTVREGVDAAELTGGRSAASSSSKGPVNRDGALFNSAENSDLGCCGPLHPHCGIAVFSFVDQRAASIAVQNSLKLPEQTSSSPAFGTFNRRSSISASGPLINSNCTTSNQGLDSAAYDAQNVVHHAKTTRFVLETMCSALQTFGGYFVAVENHTPVPGSRVWDAPVAVFPTLTYCVVSVQILPSLWIAVVRIKSIRRSIHRGRALSPTY